MAIIDCEECGKPMSSHALACPSCGAPPPRGVISRMARWIGIVFIGIIGLSLFFNVRSCNESANQRAARTPEAPAAQNRPQATNKLPKPPPPPVVQSEPSKPEWSYSTNTDEISGKTTPMAVLRSTNTHDLSFPYGPGIGAELVLRRSVRGPDVSFITIDKGQFLCHASDPCIAVLKFDGREEKLIKARQPSGGRSDVAIFEYSFIDMVDDLRRAKHLMIEMPIYKDGRRVWKFDVSEFSPGKL